MASGHSGAALAAAGQLPDDAPFLARPFGIDALLRRLGQLDHG